MLNSTIFIPLIMIVFLLIVLISVLMVLLKKKSNGGSKEFNSLERFHEIDMAIDRAINNKDFDIVYQPIFNLDTEEVVAAEALLRLNDKELGILFPDEFISVAEKTGKITELGKAVFDKVCEFAKNNNLQDTNISYLEVNLSITECLQNELPDRIADTLDSYGISRNFISLEIKESAISIKDNIIQHNINKLHELGIGLTLDDYGTGSSTLAYVMTLPFRGVKIDRTLLWKAMKNENAMYAMCANINTLKDMNTKIMIEGAESEEMVEKLRSLKCDYVQGFYFATPMSETELIEFIS